MLDLIAIRTSLHGELLWDMGEPFKRGGELQTSEAAAVGAESVELVVVVVQDVAGWEKYPPGEGKPSGPRPGLRLSTRVGGLHR